jgi:2'-5' RNA ligase
VRLFVAVWPDDSTRERLSGLELGRTEGLRLVRPGQWHVTLRFLGEVDGGLVPVLVGALRTAATKLPDSIHCGVGPATAWFSHDRVLQIPVSGLDEAADAVHHATLPVVPDAARGEPPFTGHLTVARSRPRRPALSEITALAGIPISSSFAIDSFDLVVSQPSPEGSRFSTLERLSLRE